MTKLEAKKALKLKYYEIAVLLNIHPCTLSRMESLSDHHTSIIEGELAKRKLSAIEAQIKAQNGNDLAA